MGPEKSSPDAVGPRAVSPCAVGPDAVSPEAVAPNAVSPDAVGPAPVACLSSWCSQTSGVISANVDGRVGEVHERDGAGSSIEAKSSGFKPGPPELVLWGKLCVVAREADLIILRSAPGRNVW